MRNSVAITSCGEADLPRLEELLDLPEDLLEKTFRIFVDLYLGVDNFALIFFGCLEPPVVLDFLLMYPLAPCLVVVLVIRPSERIVVVVRVPPEPVFCSPVELDE